MAASSSELSILVKAVDDASATLRHISDNTDHLGTRAGFAAAAWSAAFDLMVSAGGALKDGIGSVIGAAADFEAKLSGIKAVTGASAEDMANLSALALQLGKDTSFSAAEAADAIGELAKGGVQVADIMGGAAATALNLAAAGGASVAESAALAANAMSLFGIEGAKTAEVADKVAGFANATTGSMTDFKFALQAVGSVAHIAGQSFDDTATAIALMGQAGILGSDAGTSLKTMLINLQNPSNDAKNAMEQLGIFTLDTKGAMDALTEHIQQKGEPGLKALDKAAKDGTITGKELFKILTDMNDPITKNTDNFNELAEKIGFARNKFIDAEGNFVSLREVAEALHEGMENLDESTGLMALKMAFGTDAIRAAAILAEAGAEGFDNMAESLDHVSAAAVAAERLDNFKGSMEALEGSMDTFKIMLGTAFLPALRDLVDLGTQVLNTVIIPWAEEHGPAMAATASAIGDALGEMAHFIAMDVFPILVALGDKSEAAQTAASDAFEALRTFITQSVLPDLQHALSELGTALSEWITVAIPEANARLLDLASAILAFIAANAEPIATKILTEWVPAFTAWVLGTALPALLGLLPQLIAQIITWAATGGATQIADAGKAIGTGIVNGTMAGIANLAQKVADWIAVELPPKLTVASAALAIASEVLGTAILTGITTGLGGIGAIFTTLGTTVTTAMDTLKTAVLAKWDVFKTDQQPKLDAIRDATAGLWDGLNTGVETAFDTLKTTILTAWDTIKTDMGTRLDGIKTAIATAWDGISTIVSTALSEAKTEVETGWDAVKTAAGTKLDEISTAVETIWTDITTAVATALETAKTNAETGWDAVKTAAGTKLDEIGTAVSTLWETVAGFVTTALEAAKTAAETGWEAVKTAAATKLGEIATAASAVWVAIVTAVGTELGNAKTAVETGWEAVKTAAGTKLDEIATAVSAVWASIVTAVGLKLGEIVTALGTWKDDIVAKLGTIATEMLTAAQGIGTAIIDGIKAGLAAKAGELNTTIQGLLTGPLGLLQAAKAAINAESPSIEFQDKVGKPIIEGIEKGMELEAPNLFEAIKGIVKDTILTASAEVEVQEPELRRAWGNALTIIENALAPLGDVLTEAEKSAGIFKGTLADIPPALDAMDLPLRNVKGLLADQAIAFDAVTTAANNATTAVGNFVGSPDPVQSTSPIPLPAPLPGGPGNNAGGSGPGGGGAGSTVNPILGGGPPPSGPNYSFGNGPYSGSGGISTMHFHGNQSHTHEGGNFSHNHIQGSFAEGGIALGPTLAMIGDNPSGKEMIVPLERAGELGFGGGGGIHIHMEGATIYGEPDLEAKIINAVRRAARQRQFDKEFVTRTI